MPTRYSAVCERTRASSCRVTRFTWGSPAVGMVESMYSEVRGVVVEGDHRGRALGYPTANLASETTAPLPEDGVYAGHAVRADGSTHLAAISIGTRPTYYGAGAPVVAEAHLLDFDDDLYGEELTILIEERLRGQLRFDSEEELKARMANDVDLVRSWAIAQKGS
jgi:FAD synthase